MGRAHGETSLGTLWHSPDSMRNPMTTLRWRKWNFRSLCMSHMLFAILSAAAVNSLSMAVRRSANDVALSCLEQK
jgi:hypothetical protein